ncbi:MULTISPECIES: CgeB family protein [unclassified Isoptericola]|uniref:CgeB family protein n=1 Tax=unclassified Isoptericola TaxID=2623355 RepID=UPI003654DD21
MSVRGALRTRARVLANAVSPSGAGTVLGAWAIALVVFVVLDSGFAALVIGVVGTIVGALVSVHARSQRRYLLAIHAESRRAVHQNDQLKARLQLVEKAARQATAAATDAGRSASEAATAARAAQVRDRSVPSDASTGGQIAHQSEGSSETPSKTPSRLQSVRRQGPPAVGHSWYVRAEEAADAAALVSLSGPPIHLAVPVRQSGRLAVEVDLRSPSQSVDAHAARLTAQFRASNGGRVVPDTDPLPLRYSPGVKNLLTLDVPEGTSTVRLEIGRDSRNAEYKILNRMRVREIDARAKRPRTARHVRMAMVADPFTYNSFKFECDVVSIHPERWQEQFEQHAPEIFFCESAWTGATPEREWRGQVYASDAWSQENRKTLIEILEHCRSRGIPTVFWNKEDPSHYDDRRHDFVKTALMFDHIFTTDEACVDRYRNEWGAASVHALPFAAQPLLYNPANAPAERRPGAIFAGSWYANHVGRSAAMSSILDSLIGSGTEVVIHDRFYGDSDPNHVFPKRYQSFTRPAIPHAALARAYKEYELGLNFNTETRSPTMFARRVFELAMSGTIVVSNYSRGVERFFGDDVVFLDRDPGRLQELSAADRGAMRESALTKVLSEHTYARRLEAVLDTAGISYDKPDGRVDVLAVVASRDEAADAARQADQLAERRGRLTLVTDPSLPASHVQDFYRDFASDATSVVGASFAVDALATAGCASARPSLLLGDTMPSPEDLDAGLLHAQYARRGTAIVGDRGFRYGTAGTDVPLVFSEGALPIEGIVHGKVHENVYRV